MWWSRGQAPPSVIQSERGCLALAGREAPLTPREAFVAFRDLDWADNRKRRHRRNATRAQVAALLLTALSTLVLGMAAIPGRAYIAFRVPVVPVVPTA